MEREIVLFRIWVTDSLAGRSRFSQKSRHEIAVCNPYYLISNNSSLFGNYKKFKDRFSQRHP